MSDHLLQLISEHEQDDAMAREWLSEQSDAALMHVWDTIQIAYDDPAKEAMSRLAQWAMCQLLIEERFGGKSHGEVGSD